MQQFFQTYVLIIEMILYVTVRKLTISFLVQCRQAPRLTRCKNESEIFNFYKIVPRIGSADLYVNRSNYGKLPALWRKDLDVYLDDCSSHYTAQTLELTRIYCSEGLLFLDDMGVHDIADIIYDAVIKLIGTKMYCSDKTDMSHLLFHKWENPICFQ